MDKIKLEPVNLRAVTADEFKKLRTDAIGKTLALNFLVDQVFGMQERIQRLHSPFSRRKELRHEIWNRIDRNGFVRGCTFVRPEKSNAV